MNIRVGPSRKAKHRRRYDWSNIDCRQIGLPAIWRDTAKMGQSVSALCAVSLQPKAQLMHRRWWFEGSACGRLCDFVHYWLVFSSIDLDERETERKVVSLWQSQTICPIIFHMQTQTQSHMLAQARYCVSPYHLHVYSTAMWLGTFDIVCQILIE